MKPVRQFHAIEGGCDANRRAAFLARLISKHHPIEYHGAVLEPDTAVKQKNPVLRINERFALHALLHFLNVPPNMFTVILGQADGKKILADLMFIFTHRDPQIESLVCIARLLRACSGLQSRSVPTRIEALPSA